MAFTNKPGITIVKNSLEGEEIAKDFLYKNSDTKTVLFLSGGKTPKSLYGEFLVENRLRYGAVGMIDERYGEVGHPNSNASMMEGFNPFYPILNGESLENTALQYEQTVRDLFDKFSKSIGILGIGSDGHTAGIPAGIKNYELRIKNEDLVTFFEDFPGENPKRVTMTFNALEKLDQIIILVFGEDKKKALELMFKEGPIEEIPARFYLRPEIAAKTTLVTDQQV